MKQLLHDATPAGSRSPIDTGAIRELARQDMAARRTELQTALESDDWPRVARLAHYLATTADLLDDTALRAACVVSVDAIRAGDIPRARAAAALIARAPAARSHPTY